jgi:hypothetical protein
LDDRPRLGAQLAALAVSAAAMAAITWFTIPPWEREHLARMARCRARWLAGRLAWMSGRLAITEEHLTGTEPVWRHRLTERLSRARDNL